MSTPNAIDADFEQARQLRRALADELLSRGSILSEAWREVFERVPRHMFIPRFFIDREHTGRYEPVESSNPAQRIEWLAGVYSNDALITQLDGTDETWAPDGRPTSSSTMPSLMALMLEALDIRDGMDLLEIGTGTGYNAALLCERLGSDHVTSVDIDPALISAARRRLLALGYAPRAEAHDGILGYAPNAPYDRILATVGLPSVPHSWIEQTRRNGQILVNLYRDLGGGALARLTVFGDRAEGNFLPDYGGFMPTRSENAPDTLALLSASQNSQGDSRLTDLGGYALNDSAFSFLAALRIPAGRIEVHGESGPDKFWLLDRDGSWAYQTTDTAGRKIAVQGGKRRLWDELEAVHAEWKALGQPPRNDFGLTVTREGQHLLWHRRPDAANWELAFS